jgi:hypothetical protein
LALKTSTLPLFVLGLEVIDPELGEQRREARDALPRPEGRTLVAHHHLGLAVPRDRLLERGDHEVSALGAFVDAVADDVAGVVVDDNQREGVGAVDVSLHEVEVPQVIRAHGFEALIVRLALDLRRAIPGLLHHAAGRIDADLDALAAELVADLAGTEPRVAVPLVEDLLVPLRFELLRRGPRRR